MSINPHEWKWQRIKVYSYPKKACNGLPTIMVQRCNTFQGDWKWLSSFMISGQPIPFRPTQKHSKWTPTWVCLRVENPANSHFSILLDELLYFPNFFSLKKRAHPGQKAHCDHLQLGEPAPLRLTKPISGTGQWHRVLRGDFRCVCEETYSRLSNVFRQQFQYREVVVRLDFSGIPS